VRKKPDIDQFKPIKDPASFLEGGAADAATGMKYHSRLILQLLKQ